VFRSDQISDQSSCADKNQVLLCPTIHGMRHMSLSCETHLLIKTHLSVHLDHRVTIALCQLRAHSWLLRCNIAPASTSCTDSFEYMAGCHVVTPQLNTLKQQLGELQAGIRAAQAATEAAQSTLAAERTVSVHLVVIPKSARPTSPVESRSAVGRTQGGCQHAWCSGST
jgi:hypothetical protein